MRTHLLTVMTQAKPTTSLLKQLRELMQNPRYVASPLSAYIVPSNDAHNSEYLAECDKRRAFICGFTGSAGTAIVTHDYACMWTDGRYYLQASEEMDSNWTLMKEGIPGTPTQGDWLSRNLPTGSKVGVDPNLLTYSKWMPLKSELEIAGHKLIPVEQNLVDVIWEDKPDVPCNPVKPLGIEFTGQSIYEKFQKVQEQMQDKNASVLVLTALDEIAYFLNLRGCDIEYNPVFFSYVLITRTGYILFVDPQKYSPEVEQHLSKETGTATFEIRNYNEVIPSIRAITENMEGFAWFSENSAYALTNLVQSKHLLTEITPIALMKAVKNPTEIRGMKNAHVRDGIALCSYFSWLEKSIDKEEITEVSGAEKLAEFRALQKDFMGPSFTTISSVGPHAAIIHYQPDKAKDIRITRDSVYLCDSGGQYKDGTTDVTRTFHFGTPTTFEKECYTRVLKGQIQIARMVFPSKVKGNCLDSFARQYLWEVGLDYGHGTGHGIGAYLNVHEGPMGVSWRYIADDPGLECGMFLSNEPGYYEDGKFGLRIEDIVLIVDAQTPYNFNSRGFLTFETVTLAPIQTKMILVEMLTEDEISHLNSYHQKCRDVLGPILDEQGLLEVKEWLWKETQPISDRMLGLV
ncbi:Peptidase [Oryctes borbonicus]|uniref:Peptidase n=1 Tax=Oryctes borbonicus TaxID=1629725 RepID=A0A0T6ATZ3_9SCAR|nr:Peptidase [Oryctes borbonicus]